jgi:hypothetical protein
MMACRLVDVEKPWMLQGVFKPFQGAVTLEAGSSSASISFPDARALQQASDRVGGGIRGSFRVNRTKAAPCTNSESRHSMTRFTAQVKSGGKVSGGVQEGVERLSTSGGMVNSSGGVQEGVEGLPTSGGMVNSSGGVQKGVDRTSALVSGIKGVRNTCGKPQADQVQISSSDKPSVSGMGSEGGGSNKLAMGNLSASCSRPGSKMGAASGASEEASASGAVQGQGGTTFQGIEVQPQAPGSIESKLSTTFLWTDGQSQVLGSTERTEDPFQGSADEQQALETIKSGQEGTLCMPRVSGNRMLLLPPSAVASELAPSRPSSRGVQLDAAKHVRASNLTDADKASQQDVASESGVLSLTKNAEALQEDMVSKANVLNLGEEREALPEEAASGGGRSRAVMELVACAKQGKHIPASGEGDGMQKLCIRERGRQHSVLSPSTNESREGCGSPPHVAGSAVSNNNAEVGASSALKEHHQVLGSVHASGLVGPATAFDQSGMKAHAAAHSSVGRTEKPGDAKSMGPQRIDNAAHVCSRSAGGLSDMMACSHASPSAVGMVQGAPKHTITARAHNQQPEDACIDFAKDGQDGDDGLKGEGWKEVVVWRQPFIARKKDQWIPLHSLTSINAFDILGSVGEEVLRGGSGGSGHAAHHAGVEETVNGNPVSTGEATQAAGTATQRKKNWQRKAWTKVHNAGKPLAASSGAEAVACSEHVVAGSGASGEHECVLESRDSFEGVHCGSSNIRGSVGDSGGSTRSWWWWR